MSDQLLDSNPDTMLTTVAASGEIQCWNDQKKSEFVSSFQSRVRVARFLLERTANLVMQTALRRQFIGQQHMNKVYGDSAQRHGQYVGHHLQDEIPEPRHGAYKIDSVGGREISDLDKVVHQRADEILKGLPSLAKAVQIIDPETAAMIVKVEKLKAAGQKLKTEVDEVTEPIIMAEMDQKMTIGEFRDLVKSRDKKRRDLLEKMHELGKEGSQLEEVIYKKLYKGLPGLAEAVVSVVQTHLDRSTALDTMSRRVEEQVKFGDSETALELLRHFEKDEVEVSGKVHTQFHDVLEKLKLSVKKGRTLKGVK